MPEEFRVGADEEDLSCAQLATLISVVHVSLSLITYSEIRVFMDELFFCTNREISIILPRVVGHDD